MAGLSALILISPHPVRVIPLGGTNAGAGASGTSIGGTLLGGRSVGSVPADFWSLVAQTASRQGFLTNPDVGQFVNASPFGWFRYGQQNDQCNISSNQMYGDNGQVVSGCGFDLSSFKDWCASRAAGCHTFLDLPGENNNSVEDAVIAKWIVHTVGFQPDYWSIGNEPQLWKHYGKPWGQWATTDHRAPTPLAYAFDVKAAIAAVKKVDPGAKFIGIQADCECSPTWFKAIVQVNGPNLSAIAYHTYPSTYLQTSETLAQYYAPLASTSNITTSYATVRADIAGKCGGCATLPIFVGEFNSGPGWSPSNWGGSYANAVFLAASTIQALEARVAMLSIFNLQTYSTTSYGYSLMNGSSALAPPGVLYTSVLRHLVGGTIETAPIKTTLGNVWALREVNGLKESLFVVNANLGHPLSLSLGTILPLLIPATSYSWGPGQSTPTAASGLSSSSVKVPSQGILLLNLALPVAAPNSTFNVSSIAGAAEVPVQLQPSSAGAPEGQVFAALSPVAVALARGRATPAATP
ncbi:MAG: hypothetical protein L3K23_02405 [Thermoplasmata archaeon]|nr:hypothetical protein [Thermoplasmata archaeon]